MTTDSNKTIAIFTINGINSLLGWNAVLASLDYFQKQFASYNIYSFLPIPLFLGYLITGFSYHILSNRFKYISLITIGNTIISLALAFILFVSITLDQTTIGYSLLLLASFLIGLGANASQLTFFAMINYLSQDVVSKFTVGTALSGLFITLIRMIILAIAGANNDSIYPIIIYFAIAIAFNTGDLFLNRAFCASTVYYEKIDAFLLHHDDQQQKSQGNISKTQISDKLNEKIHPISINPDIIQEEQRIQNQFFLKTFVETLKAVHPYPMIIMFTFVITFILFPGPTFSKTFDGLDISWSVIIFLISYNIGDTTGKYSAEFNGAFNKYSLIFIFFARLIFFFPITIMADGADQNDPLINNYVFPFINQLLFGFTNGFCINASFIMAFRVCPIAYKKYAGVFCGLILQIGIMLGTVLQVPYSYIIGIN